jgi:hypothetical protein
MTYVYTGPSTLAIIGIAVVSAVVTAGVIYGLWWFEGWWLERREEPGPIDPGVDGVMLEPADDHDPPFPDGWHAALADAADRFDRWLVRDGYCTDGACSHTEPGWTPSPADVELGRQLTRERFGGAPTGRGGA